MLVVLDCGVVLMFNRVREAGRVVVRDYGNRFAREREDCLLEKNG